MKRLIPMNWSCLCAMVAFTITLASCSSDLEDVGSGTSILEVSASLIAPVQAKSVLTENRFTGNLNFTSGYIWVSAVEFDGTLDRGTSINRRVERASRIDFMSGEGVPPIDDVIIPSGTYSYVNIEAELRDEDTQPAIVMEGTYTRTDGSSVPLRFEFNSGETFEAETEQTITLTEDATVIGKIVIDPYTWFTNVSAEMMDNANINANGVLLITGEFNEDIYDLVSDGLDESTESEFIN
ncbi:hypothetical protein E7Z59_12575 [Robertkochia marina]|uniref:DUF4382 domain-containing protein n=1 Tax=Robertkochia marina TaxID=1227945 RepID=A0A4S3LYF5_9FLAO|nr:hypothetical protein [Robertkochia marina]THD66619.1 hypothetical protein E7Z59_12575 [Robertkochia marina]TRZ45543.1 hypothetical protein D3A96_06055 [Robertkochia marina]